MDVGKKKFTGLRFDEAGGAKEVLLQDADFSTGLSWVHFDYTVSGVEDWILKQSGLDEFIGDALLLKETRPRVILTPKGILLILRIINNDPKEDPEDMISLRLWIEERLIISVSRRDVIAVNELMSALKHGSGPANIGDFLDRLTDRITDGISDQVAKIDVAIDLLEEEVFEEIDDELREKLAEQRKQIIALKRFVAPQRDALSRLVQIDKFVWLGENYRLQLMENSDRTIRCVEDLDEAKDRAVVVQETLSSRLSERVEQRMYLLSMIAAIFLPLSFITGLLGINVGGIPGAQHSLAFPIVSLLLLFTAVFEFWLFKRKQWI